MSKLKRTEWFSCATPPQLPGIYETVFDPAACGRTAPKRRVWDGAVWRFMTGEASLLFGYPDDRWRGLKREAGK